MVAFAFGLAAAALVAVFALGLTACVLGLAAALVVVFALVTADFAATAVGLRADDVFAAVVDAFVADVLPVDDAFAVDALAALAERERDEPAADLAPAARTVRADVAERAVVVLAVPLVDRVAVDLAGIVVDIALAASVSDLTAVSIALVAVLIATSAVVIVLAEVVALLAAVFSLAAAAVTLVAAVETVRGVVADDFFAVVRRLAVVDRAALLVAGRAALLVAVLAVADVRPAVARAAGLAGARVVVFLAALAAGDLAELVRLALAVLGRAGFCAAAVVGTDLPPSGSVTGSLIPRSIKFYTSTLHTQ